MREIRCANFGVVNEKYRRSVSSYGQKVLHVRAQSKRRLLIMLALLTTVVSISSAIPFARAAFCQLQVAGIDFPQTAAINQTVQTTTRLVITCVTSMVDIAGRVDLIDQASMQTLSVSGFQVGYISQPEKTVNVTVSNLASAPNQTGSWALGVVVRLFAGGVLVAVANQPFQIQVASVVTSVASTASTDYLVVGVAVAVVAMVIVCAFLLFFRKRKSKPNSKSKK